MALVFIHRQGERRLITREGDIDFLPTETTCEEAVARLSEEFGPIVTLEEDGEFQIFQVVPEGFEVR